MDGAELPETEPLPAHGQPGTAARRRPLDPHTLKLDGEVALGRLVSVAQAGPLDWDAVFETLNPRPRVFGGAAAVADRPAELDTFRTGASFPPRAC
ncbi:hypothetical protein [Actinomadura sp. 3N407]|uniref:hypothetical protein n=1 Tax=Actinomadura sp. 3N407 TaxID=3457423 RepID=UPI003FCDA9E5